MIWLVLIMILILRNEGHCVIDAIKKRSFPFWHFPLKKLNPKRFQSHLILSGGYSSSSNLTNHEISSGNSDLHEINSSTPILYSTPPEIIQQLSSKYANKFYAVTLPHLPHCEFFLCGTLHVADTSVNMVNDVIQTLKPNFVVIELCEGRIDGLIEEEQQQHQDVELVNITLSQVLKSSFRDRSIKTLGIGLLTWMQIKAAKMVGSKLGGELSAACRQAYLCGATVILGDRLYSVTIQRIFDHLTFFEKMKMIFVITWEIFNMSIFKLKDYIQKSEDDSNFIQDELDRFAKYLPAFAKVVITERDEYIAQTLYELGTIGFGNKQGGREKGRIVVVIGAGHLSGVQKNLPLTPFNEERLKEISSSSKQGSTWPGKGVLHVVDINQIFNKSPKTSSSAAAAIQQ